MKTIQKLTTLRMDQIRPGDNTRTAGEMGNLRELADSIARQGLINPIHVWEYETGRYEVVMGHRRFAALGLLGAETVDCMVRPGPDMMAQIVENDQRVGVAPLSEARRFAEMQGQGLSVGDIASRIGRSWQHVSRRMRLLRLAPALLTEMASGSELPVEWFEEVARLDEATQNHLLVQARGNYGPRTGAAVRAFVSQAGIPMTTTPWDLSQPLGGRPPCVGCALRIGGGLFEDVATCMGRSCYGDKLAAQMGLPTIGKGGTLRWADHEYDPLGEGDRVVDLDSHPPQVVYVKAKTQGAEAEWKPQVYRCGGVTVKLAEKPSPEVLEALETLNRALEAKWSLMSG